MKNWLLMVVLGVIFIVMGVLALFNPFPASLAVEQVTGWTFLIVGVLQIIAAFRSEGWNGKAWALLLGVVSLLLGISLVFNPLNGLVALTLILGIMFIVSGIFKAMFGFKIHKSEFKWAVLLSALVSLILGSIVLTNIPVSAGSILGIMLAVELICSGVSTTILGLSRKAGGVESA